MREIEVLFTRVTLTPGAQAHILLTEQQSAVERDQSRFVNILANSALYTVNWTILAYSKSLLIFPSLVTIRLQNLLLSGL